MYPAESVTPKVRAANMLWMCDPVRSSDPEEGCPSNCVAQNYLPYITIEYEARNFPEDSWTIVPCERHSSLFRNCPDARGRN